MAQQEDFTYARQSFETDLKRIYHYFKGSVPSELLSVIELARAKYPAPYSVTITISFGGGMARTSVRSVIYILPAVQLIRLFRKYAHLAPHLKVSARIIDVSCLTLEVNPELVVEEIYSESHQRMAYCKNFIHTYAPDVASDITFIKLQDLCAAKEVILPSKDYTVEVLASLNFTEEETKILKAMAKPRKLTAGKAAAVAPQLSSEERVALTKHYVYNHLFFHGDYLCEDNIALFDKDHQIPDLMVSIGGHAEERFNVFRQRIREHLTKLTDRNGLIGRNVSFPQLIRIVGKAYGKQPPYMYSDKLDEHMTECREQGLLLDPAVIFSTPSEKNYLSANAIPNLSPDEVRMLCYFLLGNCLQSFNPAA